jgi:hypothetical protein
MIKVRRSLVFDGGSCGEGRFLGIGGKIGKELEGDY